MQRAAPGCQAGVSAPRSEASADPPLPVVIRGRCSHPLQSLFPSASSEQAEGSRPLGRTSRHVVQGRQLCPSRDGPSIMENSQCSQPGAVGACLHAHVPWHLLKPTLHYSVPSSDRRWCASVHLDALRHTLGRMILLNKGLFKMSPAF